MQTQRVQLEGARGPLSPQASKAILKRLQSRGEETSIFDRHLAVEEHIVASPLVVGNKVALLQDGPATFQAMFTAIRNAKDHINMETYIIEDDEVGKRFADALIEKQSQGVSVNFIYDSVGGINLKKAVGNVARALKMLKMEDFFVKFWRSRSHPYGEPKFSKKILQIQHIKRPQ